MATPGRASVWSTFLRSFLIQGSWNYKTMLGSGFAFAMLPSLRRIFRDDEAGLRDSVRRHAEHFNAHPYLSGVALGAAVRLEAEGEAPEQIRRFKTAVRGPLGGLGDSLVWASWLPAVSVGALSLLWLGAPGWVAVLAFLVVYNLGHVLLRAWGYRAGLADGLQVSRSLARASLGAWTERVRAAEALLLGLLVGAALGARGGLGEAGPLWAALAGVAFVAGDLLGHRLWRPAAVGIVVAVGILVTVGLR